MKMNKIFHIIEQKIKIMANETNKQEQNVEPDATIVETENVRLIAADGIVKRNMWYAAGFGIIPVPFVEVVGTGAMQLKMIGNLCKLYDTPFNKELGRGIVSVLLGSVSALGVAAGVSSLLKAVPFFGGLLSGASFAVTGAAVTYAMGKIFTQHFEAGGTMLTFNPEKMKSYFRDLYEEGKTVAQNMAREAKAKVV